MYGRTHENGQVLTLAASGWTVDSLFVLYDHETESMWFPSFGGDGVSNLICIAGELQDTMLFGVAWDRTEWRFWQEATGPALLMVTK